jgi:16S rRNA (cytosine967-C5)-methyltransferase
VAVTPARRCAYQVVRRVFEQGAFADHAFRTAAERLELHGRDRALAMRIAYGTIQRKATLDHLIERLSERPVAKLDPPVTAALRVGLYQLAYLDAVPDHAAVGESVELVKSERRGGEKLVNAVLRRATREAEAILASLGEASPAEAALRHSQPEWIARLWWDALGPDDALALMRASNDPAESSVRANTLRTSPGELLSSLAAEGIAAHSSPLPPEAVILEEPYDVHGSPLFADGALMPQARASMLVAHAVDPAPGERVLDLCAAPGAKTSHLAALMEDDGQIVALDLDPRRLEAVARNCRRLGAQSVETRAGDARDASFAKSFDRVLVDPPCSDLGTLQSRPDVRWRKSAAQIEELRSTQREILEMGARALRPGGRLVYSTCTISPPENELLVRAFLADHPEFDVFDLSAPYPGLCADGGFLQTYPHRDRTDGFFIAALEREG